jgi:hypothetical protein
MTEFQKLVESLPQEKRDILSYQFVVLHPKYVFKTCQKYFQFARFYDKKSGTFFKSAAVKIIKDNMESGRRFYSNVDLAIMFDWKYAQSVVHNYKNHERFMVKHERYREAFIEILYNLIRLENRKSNFQEKKYKELSNE